MKILACIVGVAALAGAMAGCTAEPVPGQMKFLGPVNYGDAFTAAREVLARHYEIASADRDVGTIQCRPKLFEPSSKAVFGAFPTREVATMTLLSDKYGVTARLAIAVQRRAYDTMRAMGTGPTESYSSVPNQTPASEFGATSPEQNASWVTERYATDTEKRILSEMEEALRLTPATKAATQPEG
ncbi:MAG: hypothetical protein ACE15C_04735 [Phycisphaerae bacterium]